MRSNWAAGVFHVALAVQRVAHQQSRFVQIGVMMAHLGNSWRTSTSTALCSISTAPLVATITGSNTACCKAWR